MSTERRALKLKTKLSAFLHLCGPKAYEQFVFDCMAIDLGEETLREACAHLLKCGAAAPVRRGRKRIDDTNLLILMTTTLQQAEILGETAISPFVAAKIVAKNVTSSQSAYAVQLRIYKKYKTDADYFRTLGKIMTALNMASMLIRVMNPIMTREDSLTFTLDLIDKVPEKREIYKAIIGAAHACDPGLAARSDAAFWGVLREVHRARNYLFEMELNK